MTGSVFYKTTGGVYESLTSKPLNDLACTFPKISRFQIFLLLPYHLKFCLFIIKFIMKSQASFSFTISNLFSISSQINKALNGTTNFTFLLAFCGCKKAVRTLEVRFEAFRDYKQLSSLTDQILEPTNISCSALCSPKNQNNLFWRDELKSYRKSTTVPWKKANWELVI